MKYITKRIRGIARASILLLTLPIVSACGGSSGGSSVTQFTSFSQMPANGVTELQGQAVTANYTADLGTGDVAISNVSGPNASTALITSANGLGIALQVSAPGSSVSFDTRQGDTINRTGGFVGFETANGQSVGFLIDEQVAGYEYQTFGAWLTGYGTASGTVGAGSYGARTSAANVPVGQVANYNGAGIGVARRADGQPYATVSAVEVSTNFSTATISSTGTQAVNLDTAAASSAAELDYTGSGPVSGAGFTASVSGIATSGKADGIFYGPSANEVGGTYQLTGPGGVVHAGAFGGN